MVPRRMTGSLEAGPRLFNPEMAEAIARALENRQKTRNTKMSNLKFQGRAALTNTVVEFQVPQEMVGDEEAWAIVDAQQMPDDTTRFRLHRATSRSRWHHGYQGRTMARLVIPHHRFPGLDAMDRFGNSPAAFEFNEDRDTLFAFVRAEDANDLRRVDRRKGSTAPAAPVDLAALSAAVRAINEAVAADPDLSLSLVDGRVRLALIKELG